MPSLVNMFSGDVGSQSNQGIEDIKKSLFSDKVGKVVITNKNSDRASAIIVSDDGVRITDPGTTGGVNINKDGIVIQGATTLTSKATNVRKGEYSENPKSNKIFTYQETILFESIPKEMLNNVVGATTGMNTGTGMDGMVPIFTDISAGPLPHFHTISMKHVHRIEPAYLYRVPPSVGFIKGALNSLQQFFKL